MTSQAWSSAAARQVLDRCAVFVAEFVHVTETGSAVPQGRGVGSEQAGGAASLRRAVVAVVALSLAVRLVWAGLAHVVPVSDFAAYDTLAWKWLTTGNFKGAFRTPGYPAFLAAIYWLFGHSWRAAQIFQALLGAVTSGLIVLLAGRISAPRTAAIAGLLHALWPTSIAYVAVLASENLAVPLSVGMLLALTAEVASPRRRMWATGLSGLLFALLVLVRPASLAFLPALALLAVWEPCKSRWRAVPALVFAAAALVAMAPWLIHNHRSGIGATTIATNGGMNLWMGNSDRARTGGYDFDAAPTRKPKSPRKEKKRDETLRAEGLRWIVDHPGRYLALCGVRTARMWGTTADGFAAKHLWPTAENSALLLVADAQPPPDAQVRESARVVLARHRAILRWLRVVAAPLILLAFALCLLRLRRYCAVTLPVLCYAGFLTATYFIERLRELSDPLLLISLAVLISDLFLGTQELPGTRLRKASLAAALVLVSAVLRKTGWDAGLYRL